jgi:GTP-binding protein
VDIAISTATEILFVVDGREGLTPVDHDVAKKLRKAHRPIRLVVNKLDTDKQDFHESVFTRLGFGNTWGVSAAHGRGIGELMEAVIEKWPVAAETETKPDRATRVAVVGRPNVGKSSLINALLKQSRTIVSDVAGTTRDAIDVPYEFNGKPFEFIDTAGMRQERRVHDELEQSMTGRTAHTINRADVCVLVVDAERGVAMQEKKIAGLISKAMCPCVIVVNKWDLIRAEGDGGKKQEREYYNAMQTDLFFVNYAPVVFLSAKTGERLKGLLERIEKIAETRVYHFATGPINRVIKKAIEKQAPPSIGNKRFKVYYAAQLPDEGHRPLPALVLFCNDPDLLTPSYRRYLEIQIRESFPLDGCPIKFILKGKLTKQESRSRV